jgi:hypothetical protein
MTLLTFTWSLKSSPVEGMSTSSKSTKSKRSPQEDGPEEEEDELDDEMPKTTEEGTGRKATKKTKNTNKILNDEAILCWKRRRKDFLRFFQALSHYRNFFQCTRKSAKLHAKQASRHFPLLFRLQSECQFPRLLERNLSTKLW